MLFTGTFMAGTAYPLFIDTLAQLPRVVDGISPVRADDVNRLRDAIVAIEKELGINPSATFATVRDRLDALTAIVGIVPPNMENATSIIFDFLSVGLESPINKTYNIVNNIPYDGYIFSVTTKASSGTATATVKINNVPLGGGPNSVSVAEQTVLHSTNRMFLPGDDLTLEISNNAAATDVNATIIFLRFITVQDISSTSYDLDGYMRAAPAPVLDGAVPIFDGATGKFVKGSNITVDGFNNVSGLSSLSINTFTPTSTLHVFGSYASKVTTVAPPGLTLTSADNFILIDASSGNVNVALPVASTCAHRHYYIKRIDSSTNSVTIIRSGSDFIDGQTSYPISFQYESFSFVSNGSGWFVY